MTRKIYCWKCGKNWRLNATDARTGYKSRKINIYLKRPGDLGLTVYDDLTADEAFALMQGKKLKKPGKFSPTPKVVCDMCDAVLPDGTLAYAITLWREEDPPGPWEEGYGTVVPGQSAALANLLSGGDK
jgi:hypothetical protein